MTETWIIKIISIYVWKIISFFFLHFTGVFAGSGIEAWATFTTNTSSSPKGMTILFNMGSVNAQTYGKVANIREEVREQPNPSQPNLNYIYSKQSKRKTNLN